MAAQNTTRPDGAEQPSNGNSPNYKKLTVNSSWVEILEEINRIQRELEEIKRENSPRPRVNHSNTAQQPSQFNLSAIQWKVGSGRDRRDADPDEPFSYCFVLDTQGNPHPEVKPLWDAVSRYGEVHTEGWVITQFGDRAKMLAKRRPKEA